jgi:ABC-type multidrug transport system fused ATPase/permease subunit
VGDTLGRRRLLTVMGLLMALMGVALITSQSLPLLAAAAFLGSFSAMPVASGAMGPLEQASLPATAAPERRTDLFAFYGIVGTAAVSLGALAAGLPSAFQRAFGFDQVTSFQVWARSSAGAQPMWTRWIPMMMLSPALIGVAMLSVPPLVVITRLIQQRTRAAERANRRAVGVLNVHLQERLAGIEVIRAFVREQAFVLRFRRALQQALGQPHAIARRGAEALIAIMTLIPYHRTKRIAGSRQVPHAWTGIPLRWRDSASARLSK